MSSILLSSQHGMILDDVITDLLNSPFLQKNNERWRRLSYSQCSTARNRNGGVEFTGGVLDVWRRI
jgi:hypothetical protein